MTKEKMILRVAEKLGTTQMAAEKGIDALMAVIGEELQAGEKVYLPRIGVFEVVDKKAWTARNPRTGEKVQVAAHKKCVFRPSTSLTRNINA